MKVLLIQPPSCEPLLDQIHLFEPLALEYLGGGLKLDGHLPTILDARIEPDIEGALRRVRPALVGITGFTYHANIVKAIAARLKSIDPAVTVVVGGHHATVCPTDFDVPQIDLVAIGEGAFTLREIARELAGSKAWHNIAGLGIPSPQGMTFTPTRPLAALDALPHPDRSLTAHYRHNYFSEWVRPLASIRTSLGCTARCSFCALWSLTGGRYLRRDPQQVVAELQTIDEPHVFFCDDESMCDVRRMDELADLVRAAGIRKTYFLHSRADTIVAHPELFAKWAALGLRQVFVGMEACSDARLAAIKKGVTTAQQAQAAQILKKLGIMLYASFMVDPDFSRDDFRSLAAYVRRLKPESAVFAVLTPLPGTELYAARQGELLSREPELYDLLHALLPTRLPPAEFYAELARLYETAVPLRTLLGTLRRFGARGLLIRLRLLGTFLQRVRTAHLDYEAGGVTDP
jgi:hopanoid C-3 methylase